MARMKGWTVVRCKWTRRLVDRYQSILTCLRSPLANHLGLQETSGHVKLRSEPFQTTKWENRMRRMTCQGSLKGLQDELSGKHGWARLPCPAIGEARGTREASRLCQGIWRRPAVCARVWRWEPIELVSINRIKVRCASANAIFWANRQPGRIARQQEAPKSLESLHIRIGCREVRWGVLQACMVKILRTMNTECL